MTDRGPFVREVLPCPKCGCPKMILQELREMYKPQKPWHQPLYNSIVTPRVVCADCGLVVWEQNKKAAPDPTVKQKEI